VSKLHRAKFINNEAVFRRLTPTRGGVPAFLQIAQGLELAILSGALPSNTYLPSHRELMGILGVDKGTIANAFQIVRDRDLIYTKRGCGLLVADIQDREARLEAFLVTECAQMAQRVARAHVAPGALVGYMMKAVDAMDESTSHIAPMPIEAAL
jgi:DNA-binding transcriptional regulator YhcF (GntR family)